MKVWATSGRWSSGAALTPQSRRSSPSCCSLGSGRRRPASLGAAPRPGPGSDPRRTSSSRRGEAGPLLPGPGSSSWTQTRRAVSERRAFVALAHDKHSPVLVLVLRAEPVVDPFLTDSFVVQPTAETQSTLKHARLCFSYGGHLDWTSRAPGDILLTGGV